MQLVSQIPGYTPLALAIRHWRLLFYYHTDKETEITKISTKIFHSILFANTR